MPPSKMLNSVILCTTNARARERERERERDRERERETETDRQTDRQTDRVLTPGLLQTVKVKMLS